MAIVPYAKADVDQDTQVWIQSLVLGKINERYKYYFEVQPRISNDVSQLSLVIVRPAAIYQLNKEHSAWLGYAWIPIFQGGRRSENRIWQQFFRETREDRFTWIHRVRLDERFLPSLDAVVRFRYMLRTLFALEDTASWSIAAWDEVMFNLNTVPSGPKAGFDQNRFFLGISHRVGMFRIEPGYMSNFVNSPSSPDKLNHVMSVMLAMML